MAVRPGILAPKIFNESNRLAKLIPPGSPTTEPYPPPFGWPGENPDSDTTYFKEDNHIDDYISHMGDWSEAEAAFRALPVSGEMGRDERNAALKKMKTASAAAKEINTRLLVARAILVTP